MSRTITDSSAEGRNGLVTVDRCTSTSWRHLDSHPSVRGQPQFAPSIWGEFSYAISGSSLSYGSTASGAGGIALFADNTTIHIYIYSGRPLARRTYIVSPPPSYTTKPDSRPSPRTFQIRFELKFRTHILVLNFPLSSFSFSFTQQLSTSTTKYKFPNYIYYSNTEPRNMFNLLKASIMPTKALSVPTTEIVSTLRDLPVSRLSFSSLPYSPEDRILI